MGAGFIVASKSLVSVVRTVEKLQYRADIDGLRAVAVLGVLLFHSGLGIPGGFVGVDIFFVISGFLITSLILQAQHQNQFSMRVFLGRRIRRLMPAALVMTTTTLVLGYWLLIPDDYDKLAESAIAQMTLVSNFYFANSFNYFAGPAELVPLLHTWSLAVEEQFYLLFPLLLIVCRKWTRRKLFIILAILTISSFVLNILAMDHYSTEAFFLLPTRAWELLLGALLVFAPKLKTERRYLPEAGSMISIAVIAAVFFLYDKETRFPGIAAIWPCLATAGLIYFNAPYHWPTTIARWLRRPTLTYIGKISYSLYLWHWPIMVYLRYTNRMELETSTAFLGLALSFLAAGASYHFVENPFRLRRLIPSQKKLIRISSLFTLLIIGTGATISESDGLPARWNDRITRILQTADFKGQPMSKSIWNPQMDQLPAIGNHLPSSERPRILLWGDSHANAIGNVCHRLASRYGISGYIAARGNTIPTTNTYRIHDRDNTLIWNQGVMDFIERHKITHVIMAARWSDNIEGNTSGHIKYLVTDDQASEINQLSARQVLQRNLTNTLQQLTDLGIKVWIMEQVPMQQYNPVFEVVSAIAKDRTIPRGVAQDTHIQRQFHVRSILRSIDLPGVTVFDPSPNIFTKDGFAKFIQEDTLLYVDHDHLSSAGAQLFIEPLLEPVFRSIATGE